MKDLLLRKWTLLLAFLFVYWSAIAATHTVTQNTDDGTGATSGSLSWAINAATDGDIIVFNLISGDVITLSVALPVIDNSLTMDGINTATGNPVTIQVTNPGISTYRVFNINATGKTITLNDLIMRGGDVSVYTLPNYYGGVINMTGFGSTITLNHCVVKEGKAYSGGGISTEMSTNLAPTLNLNNCTVNNNIATGSGGGCITSQCTILNSTITGNNANNGGGIFENRTGKKLQIINSTISGNSAIQRGGGVYNFVSTNRGYVYLLNSIVINNTSAIGGADIYSNDWCFSYFTWTSYPSLIYQNWISTAYTAGDLGALADNGGPTQTMELSTSAPAYQTGAYAYYNATDGYYFKGTDNNYYKLVTETSFTPSNPETDKITTDQRGETRSDPPCIGAYDVGVTVYTWVGSADNDWNTAANWDVNAVPTTADNVVIANAGTAPVIASGVGASCNNLTVNSSANLTVNSGGSLITNGTISNTGTITVEKTITDGVWHLVSSPVSLATSNVFAGEYLQNWSEPTANWSDITETDVELTPGKGFGLWGVAKTSTAYSFNGTPNTGNVPINITYTNIDGLTRDGANLLGNPYPSSIDWTQVSGYGAVYYWDGAAYLAYPANTPNPGGGTYGTGSQYVPPMQGFFIVVPDDDPDSFTFTNAMRTHSGATSYYKSTKSLPDGIMLYADNGSYQDKLLIRLNDEATENMELDRDAWKFPTNTQGLSQLWSVCPDGNLSIDVRPETETIQLGFTNDQNGNYSIALNQIDGIAQAELEDTKTNVLHNLMTGAYTFDWNTTDSEERFILHLKATGTNDLDAQAAKVYTANHHVYVRQSELNSYSEMAVYDLRGRLIVKKNLSATSLQSFELNESFGAYLVQLKGESDTKSFKIVL